MWARLGWKSWYCRGSAQCCSPCIKGKAGRQKNTHVLLLLAQQHLPGLHFSGNMPVWSLRHQFSLIFWPILPLFHRQIFLRINSSPLSAPFRVYSFIGFWKWKVRRLKRENMGVFIEVHYLKCRPFLLPLSITALQNTVEMIHTPAWVTKSISRLQRSSSKPEASKVAWTKILVSSLVRFPLNLQQVIKSFISDFYQATSWNEFSETSGSDLSLHSALPLLKGGQLLFWWHLWHL